MKHRTMIITGAVLMVLMLFSGCGRVPAKDLKSFHFSYSTGNMKDSSVSYDLSFRDGVYTAKVKPDGTAAEDASVYTVDEAFVRELEAFLQEKQVERWNNFHKTDRHVMDGNGFSLSYITKNSEGISASGYMKWPKNYSEVKGGIISIFEKLQ